MRFLTPTGTEKCRKMPASSKRGASSLASLILSAGLGSLMAFPAAAPLQEKIMIGPKPDTLRSQMRVETDHRLPDAQVAFSGISASALAQRWRSRGLGDLSVWSASQDLDATGSYLASIPSWRARSKPGGPRQAGLSPFRNYESGVWLLLLVVVVVVIADIPPVFGPVPRPFCSR
ncbi:hypothetical protein EDD37DRAFT_292148 [Exophiala viscosa]|uniref:uncharacterized protein n=1 Tax=Exophiala viscosa TaxID=2486360 RepID=UPI00219BEA38|nr:hypothetical protein EDD37DRAFT_292148 [Exophiala viscosa]